MEVVGGKFSLAFVVLGTGVGHAIILEKRSDRRLSTRPTAAFKNFCPAVAMAISETANSSGELTVQILDEVILPSIGVVDEDGNDNGNATSSRVVLCVLAS